MQGQSLLLAGRLRLPSLRPAPAACLPLDCTQLSSLTRLRDLALHQVEHGPQGYAALGQLGSCLERLRLNWVSW